MNKHLKTHLLLPIIPIILLSTKQIHQSPKHIIDRSYRPSNMKVSQTPKGFVKRSTGRKEGKK